MTVIDAVELALKNERRLGSSRAQMDPAILKSFFGAVEQRAPKPKLEFPVTSGLIQGSMALNSEVVAPLLQEKESAEKLKSEDSVLAQSPRTSVAPKPDTSSVESSSASLSDLRNRAISCENCDVSKVDSRAELNGLNKAAKVLFVTEPSGNKSDEEMNPLSGASGDLFAKMIQAMKVGVEDVYVAQVHRCRLKENETIAPHESALLEQIKMIKPAVIVTFSPTALRLFCDKQSINDCRGEWINTILWRWKRLTIRNTPCH